MKITKYGHACLLVEEGSAHILIDPGSFSTVPALEKVDAILITHEHQDHIDVESLQKIRAAHPEVEIICPEQVGTMLEAEDITYTAITENEKIEIQGVSVESLGHDHAIIYGDSSPCVNTGFFIAEKLFVPGDAIDVVPSMSVEVLALPTSGPWMKLGEAVDYAKKVNPKIVFPIHDALYSEEVRRGMVPMMFTRFLVDTGIVYKDMPDNTRLEF